MATVVALALALAAVAADIAAAHTHVERAAADAEATMTPHEPHFETILHKGAAGARLGDWIGPLYIPAGQCSGVLDQMLACEGGTLLAVRVAARDARPALLSLDDALRRASVVRAPPCARDAHVSLRLACQPRRR